MAYNDRYEYRCISGFPRIWFKDLILAEQELLLGLRI